MCYVHFWFILKYNLITFGICRRICCNICMHRFECLIIDGKNWILLSLLFSLLVSMHQCILCNRLNLSTVNYCYFEIFISLNIVFLVTIAVNVTGRLSVFGQNLENISQALTLLSSTVDNQYGIRGQPRFNKVIALPVSSFHATDLINVNVV